MRNLPERSCDCGCGKTFKPKREGQRFFSKKCRFNYHNAQRLAPDAVCPHCGKPIFEGKT